MSGPENSNTVPPPKMSRKKKPTGRPRGRPPKPDEFLVPSELRRTLLAVLDEEMEVRTPDGTRKLSKFRAVIENLVANAAKGNPTALNHVFRLLVPALQERVNVHGQVMVAEYLRREHESPDPDRQVPRDVVRGQMKYAKDKY